MSSGPERATPARRRGRPARGREAPLTRKDIVDAALVLVQREGLDAVSMRRLAEDLGVSTMALYHHVPDKPSLMSAVVDHVWRRILAEWSPADQEPIEAAVQLCVTMRRVWLSYFDLASLAVAVAEPDDAFYETTKQLTTAFEALGFPDVPMAYNAVQNFTLGSVEIAAARRSASAYFGRDPKAVLTKARRLLSRRGASMNHRGLVEARFDEGDDKHFEASLRALIAGLLTAQSRA